MRWWGYMCVSDVPLGAPTPPFDDPRHLSRAISDYVIEYTNGRYGLQDEKGILITALEAFLESL